MTGKELAKGLGISGAMVSKLIARGMPTDSLDRAMRWRKRHLQTGRMKGIRADTLASTAAAPSMATTLEDLGVDPDSGDTDDLKIVEFSESRARREHYAAELAKIALDRERGALMESSAVLAVVNEAATSIRLSLEALPAILAPELAALSDEAQIHQLLHREIERRLESLSHQFAQMARLPETTA